MDMDDDDGIFISQSDEKAFTTADKGRKEALRKEIEEKMGPERAAQVQESELKSEVSLQQLKANIAGEQDEETKRQEASQDEESYNPRTKTRKEQEDEAVLDADYSPDVDAIIAKENQEPNVNDEEQTQQIG